MCVVVSSCVFLFVVMCSFVLLCGWYGLVCSFVLLCVVVCNCV